MCLLVLFFQLNISRIRYLKSAHSYSVKKIEILFVFIDLEYLTKDNKFNFIDTIDTMSNRDIIDSLVERGLAKKISFSEIDNYDYNGVPPAKGVWWSMNSSFKMDITLDFQLFQEQIEDVLSRIEGVSYRWDNAKCVWHIEFGTEPIENGKSGLEYRQVMLGKRVAQIASCEAINRFPNLVEYDDILVDNDPGFLAEGTGRWSSSELRLYSDKVKNCLFIQLTRIRGDRTSPWNIWREIYSHFSGNIFLSRLSYLQCIEGTPFDKENPIQRYVADAFVSRAICEFIQYD
jgi:hypothetical protein